MPDCYVAIGVRKARWVPWTRVHHSSGGAHRQGILTCLLLEGQWKTESLFGNWDVNKATKRDHCKTPNVEEITHLLGESNKFTKVDGTSSYLCIVLDYESSLLTTFNTPWALGPGMCQRHIPEDDGSDPRVVWRCHRNCWWHYHPWKCKDVRIQPGKSPDELVDHLRNMIEMYTTSCM